MANKLVRRYLFFALALVILISIFRLKSFVVNNRSDVNISSQDDTYQSSARIDRDLLGLNKSNYEEMIFDLIPPQRLPLLARLPKPPMIGSEQLEIVRFQGKPLRLGRGIFGWIYVAYYRPLDKLVAVKKIHKNRSADKEFGPTTYVECAVSLFLVNNRGFAPQCYGFIDAYVAVFELIFSPPTAGKKPLILRAPIQQKLFRSRSTNSISLFDLVKPTSEQHYTVRDSVKDTDLLRIACQVSRSVQILHANGIIHRDIKLKNILLQWPKGIMQRHKKVVAKLTDFGMSGPVFGPNETISQLPKKFGKYDDSWNEEKDIAKLGKTFERMLKLFLNTQAEFAHLAELMQQSDQQKRPNISFVFNSLLKLLPSHDQDHCYYDHTIE